MKIYSIDIDIDATNFDFDCSIKEIISLIEHEDDRDFEANFINNYFNPKRWTAESDLYYLYYVANRLNKKTIKLMKRLIKESENLQ